MNNPLVVTCHRFEIACALERDASFKDMCLQERGLGAKCSEGKMRDERVESMCAVFIDGRMKQSVDEFQRDLEIEVANHPREQNAKSLLELEWYRKQKLSSDSGMGSNSSWVEVATRNGEKRAVGSCGNGGQKGQECNTPRAVVAYLDTLPMGPAFLMECHLMMNLM